MDFFSGISAEPSGKNTKNIIIAVYDGAAMLDITGPAEVFAAANAVLHAGGREPLYSVRILAAERGACRTLSGVSICADDSWKDWHDPIDTLIVAGGDIRHIYKDAGFLSWLKKSAVSARRLASVCSGAFVLAEAGLLSGRRATTHWVCVNELAKRYPDIKVEPDSIYTVDRGVYTSAGITSGMDLALAMVGEDTDRRTSLDTARMLVVYLKRPGGQSQFSSRLKAQKYEGKRLEQIIEWIGDNHMLRVSVDDLAERACMSPRTFARTFAAETGCTPGRYIENLRLEHAVQLLEDSAYSISEIADKCGFGSTDSFRRIFHRAYSVTPQDFRLRFGR